MRNGKQTETRKPKQGGQQHRIIRNPAPGNRQLEPKNWGELEFDCGA